MRVEAKNIADRTPGLTDIAWQVERGKIESKLSVLKGNIERITLEGGSAKSYTTWLERYNAINCGLQAVRDAYMPQGKRKEQYLAIFVPTSRLSAVPLMAVGRWLWPLAVG